VTANATPTTMAASEIDALRVSLMTLLLLEVLL
jgi:hypothetical protein